MRMLVMVLMLVMMVLVLRKGGRRLVQRTVGGAHLKHWIGLVNGWRCVDGKRGHGRCVGMLGVSAAVGGTAEMRNMLWSLEERALRLGGWIKVVVLSC